MRGSRPVSKDMKRWLRGLDTALVLSAVLLLGAYLFGSTYTLFAAKKPASPRSARTINKPISSNSSPRVNSSPTSVMSPPVATSTAQLTPQVMPGDWPGYLFDNSSGFNPDESLLNTRTAPQLFLGWSIQAGGGISAQPVVVDNVVYWGSWDGMEHATTTSGQELWKTFLGEKTDDVDRCDPSSAGVASTATIAPLTKGGKTLLIDYVGGGDTSFYALNTANGQVVWKTPLGTSDADFIWSSPLLYQGHIYIGVASFGDCPLTQGRLVQLDAATGAVQNVFNIVPVGCLGGTQWGSPTVDRDTSDIYIATGNLGSCASPEPYAQAVVELNASTLQVKDSWQIPAGKTVLDGDFGSTPTLFTATISGKTLKMVGAVNKNGIFYAFQRGALSDGPLWQAQIATGTICPQCDGAGTVAPAAWDGTRLYIGGGNTTINGRYCEGSMRALDPATGKFLWEYCTGDARVLTPPAVIPGIVVISEGHFVTLVDTQTGAALNQFRDTASNSIFYGAPSISHDMVFVGNMDGNLYAFQYTHSNGHAPS